MKKRKKLTFRQMELLRELYILEMSNKDLAKYFEVNPATIFRNIKNLKLKDTRKSSRDILKEYRNLKLYEQMKAIETFEKEKNLT